MPVDSVLRACRILEAFPSDGEAGVQELAERTGLHKATVSRLLQTLETAGFVERTGRRGYQSLVRLHARRRLRIGYASQTEDSLFAHEVTESLRRAAAARAVDLLVFDNCYDPETTVKNADRMLKQRVDAAIEFSTFESISQVLVSKFQQAGVPMISVDLPTPGATFFGANNYEAGRLAGRALGQWAKRHWGAADEVLQIELAAGGPLLQLRLMGAMAGLRETFPTTARVVKLDGENTFEGGRRAVARHLRARKPKRSLVLAMNDPNALGALRAFEDLGREQHCAVVGQGGTADARAELRRPDTRLIGTVAYFPERYGESLVALALDILAKKALPPAVYTQHRLLTARNIGAAYPAEHTSKRIH
jgi:ribose transport system substrate-binding protein